MAKLPFEADTVQLNWRKPLYCIGLIFLAVAMTACTEEKVYFDNPEEVSSCLFEIEVAQSAARNYSDICFSRMRTMRFATAASADAYSAGCLAYKDLASEMETFARQMRASGNISINSEELVRQKETVESIEKHSSKVSAQIQTATLCERQLNISNVEPQTLEYEINIPGMLERFRRSPEQQIVKHENCIGQVSTDVVDEIYNSFPDRQAIDLNSLLASIPLNNQGICETPLQCSLKAHYDTKKDLEEGLVSGSLTSETLNPEMLSKIQISSSPRSIQRAAFDKVGLEYALLRLEYLKSVPNQTYAYEFVYNECSAIIGAEPQE